MRLIDSMIGCVWLGPQNWHLLGVILRPRLWFWVEVKDPVARVTIYLHAFRCEMDVSRKQRRRGGSPSKQVVTKTESAITWQLLQLTKSVFSRDV